MVETPICWAGSWYVSFPVPFNHPAFCSKLRWISSLGLIIPTPLPHLRRNRRYWRRCQGISPLPNETLLCLQSHSANSRMEGSCLGCVVFRLIVHENVSEQPWNCFAWHWTPSQLWMIPGNRTTRTLKAAFTCVLTYTVCSAEITWQLKEQ